MKEKREVFMRVLVVAPGAKPEEREIDGSLESMQTIVGGTIQAIYPFEDFVALICNDAAKLTFLPMNRMLWEINDVVCGTFILCRALPGEDSFCSLTDEELNLYKQRFKKTERFMRIGNTIVVMPEPSQK